MQSSSTDPSTKPTPRPRSRAKKAGGDTLHLKTKRVDDVAATDPSSSVETMIATAAYFLAEHRSFEPGHELEDWLEAERQVRERLG